MCFVGELRLFHSFWGAIVSATVLVRRTGLVAGLAVAGLMLGATAGMAQPDPDPTATDFYPPEPEPEIELTVLDPICDLDVPYLQYAIDASNFEPTDVTITWVNPTGPNVVQSGLALSGRVLWPGAVTDAAGNPLDWPGWILQDDGTWVQGDDGFTWVRPSVSVIFDVNPAITTAVAYPPSSPVCDANPPSAEPPVLPAPGDEPADKPVVTGQLPDTGASWAWLAAAAAGLLALGAALVYGSRRSARR